MRQGAFNPNATALYLQVCSWNLEQLFITKTNITTFEFDRTTIKREVIKLSSDSDCSFFVFFLQISFKCHLPD